MIKWEKKGGISVLHWQALCLAIMQFLQSILLEKSKLGRLCSGSWFKNIDCRTQFAREAEPGLLRLGRPIGADRFRPVVSGRSGTGNPVRGRSLVLSRGRWGSPKGVSSPGPSTSPQSRRWRIGSAWRTMLYNSARRPRPFFKVSIPIQFQSTTLLVPLDQSLRRKKNI